MSVPRTLEIPEGVDTVRIETARGTFAAQRAEAASPRGEVLLIPGWTGSKEDFTPLLPLLAGAGFSATAYDQRGQFETAGGPDADYSLSALAADAVTLAAAHDGPVHLLGHSFGGLVAQQAAVDSPTSWASLSLLCTGPGALGSSPARPLDQLVAAIGAVPLADIHRHRENGVVRPPDIADFLLRRFTANDPASLKAFTQHLLDAADIVDQVAATGLPAWVGRGATDDAWPHAAQDDLARRLGTTVVVIEGAAHSPAVEDPEGLAEAWLPFLRAVSG